MNLFIIGNGFDIAHGLSTQYQRFRDYIVEKYPGAEKYHDLVPECLMGNHGEEIFNMVEVAGYITRIIDECDGGNWSNLEYYLGNAIFSAFLGDLDYVDMDASDKETMRAIYRNEELSECMKQVFAYIKRLFCDWVRYDLGTIEYSGIRNKSISQVLLEGDAFLNFNYTKTLEKVYGIKQVCHIHGVVGDPEEDILFGHGDDDAFPESLRSFGADSNLNELKTQLRKNTQAALEKNRVFFKGLKDVEKIYSYGFSFSDVDMIYIEEVARRSSGATWFLNNYDSKDLDKRKRIKAFGFNINVDGRW